MVTDKNIIDLFYNNDKLISQRIKYLNIKYINEFNYLKNRYNDSDSIYETLYRIKNNVNNRPVCEVCGGHVTFIQKEFDRIKYGQAFKHTCSKKCAANSENKKNTNIKKYGVDNVAKNKCIKNKIQQTNLKKYGYKSAACSEIVKNKTKETCLKKYNNTSYLQSDKYKEYIKNNYYIPLNINNFSQLDLIKNKVKFTNLIKYGVDSYSKTNDFKEKYKQTCLEKYGVDNPLKSLEIKNKIKQICLEKYGIDNYLNRKKYFNTILNKFGTPYYFQTNEFKEKSYQTKKVNNSFNISKPEDKLYQILCEKYGTENVIRQYRSDVYPFNCDFYIKDLDLYIEYQGNWTHGKHPFDKTNPEDLKTLQLWKDKSMEVNFKGKEKNYYKHAINYWTIKDPLKRKIAKENNLNFIEIWDSNDIQIIEEIFTNKY